MPRPALRSRTLARSKVRLPGGKVVMRFTRRRPQAAHCGACGAVLPGVPRLRNAKMARVPASQKGPNRAFGGNLCSGCMRERIKTQFLKGSL